MIVLRIQQTRGDTQHCVAVSSEVVPHEGEFVSMSGSEIEGRVQSVHYAFLNYRDAPRVLDYVLVTLAGWKSSFEKD